MNENHLLVSFQFIKSPDKIQSLSRDVTKCEYSQVFYTVGRFNPKRLNSYPFIVSVPKLQ